MNPHNTYSIDVSITLCGHRITDTSKELYRSIFVFCLMKKCTVAELNVQIVNVHLVVRTPPSLSVSELMRTLKGRTAMRLFNNFPYLRKKKFWGIISGREVTSLIQ